MPQAPAKPVSRPKALIGSVRNDSADDSEWQEEFEIGERVLILNPHDPAHQYGTVQLISGDTPYGIVVDGMEDMGIHKWYTSEEIESMDADDVEAKKKKKKKKAPMKPMKMSANNSVQAKAGGLPLLPVPNRDNIQAFAPPAVAQRWSDEHAGIRAVEHGDNVITIFGQIGADFWDEGITAKSVTRQLRAIGGDVDVQINSPGGDVFEGFAIYNALREHPYNVTVKVVGMAASAASVIAMAGDKVQIGAAAFIMIHNCSVMGYGNKHDLRELADFLEPFDAALRDVYAARTGKSADQLTRWLDAETYMSGAQAIERGFADELLPSDQTTTDPKAQASDKSGNEIRGIERMLLASGLTRTQARERLSKLKGKPDAVDEGQEGVRATRDADLNTSVQLGAILSGIQSQLSHGG